MRGKIIRGVGGFYYVVGEDKNTYECRAKGIFRKDNIRPLVGDNVVISIQNEDELLGNIEEISERKNVLIRPAVANIDQAMIVFSLAKPKLNNGLLDRFLISMEVMGIETVVVFSKSDLVSDGAALDMKRAYEKCTGDTIIVSNKTSSGTKNVIKALRGKTTVLAGPSGVGKSSLVGHICPELAPKVGSVSVKTERGKHTTRHTEIFYVDKDTYLLDTPGFSSIELPDILPEELRGLIPEFYECEGKCRYQGCTHIHEPDCVVRDSLEGDTTVIDKRRYKSYTQMFFELNEIAIKSGRSSR